MSEERITPGKQDALDELIIARLAERQRKINRIKEIKQGKSRLKVYASSVTLAIAACVVALFVFAPWKSISPVDELGIQPDMTDFRSASADVAEIQTLLEKPDYDKALTKTEIALKRSDLEIDEFKYVAEVWGDEEMEYEEEQERLMNRELRWTYIYLLLKADKSKEAKKELRKYLKYKEQCEHKNEAKALLKKLD